MIRSLVFFAALFYGGTLLAEAHHFLEAGPLKEVQTFIPHKVKQTFYWPAYRIQTFGPAQISIKSSVPVNFVVEGPFASGEEADKHEVGSVPPLAEGKLARQIPLDAAGAAIYRIQIQSRPEVPIELNYKCEGKCARKAVTLPALATLIGLDKARTELMVSSLIARLVKDAEIQKKLLEQWKQHLNLPVKQRRFPVLPPIYEVAHLRELIGQNHQLENQDGAVEAEPDLEKEWHKLGRCDFNREKSRASAKEIVPGVSAGHFDDERMSKCQMAHSVRLGRILTALAANPAQEISGVKLEGEVITLKSVADVFRYLVETGHRIEMQDERTYANFLGLRVERNGEEQEAMIPPWIRTGIELKDADELVVPMGHSQHSWTVWGPRVRAKVMFFLGTGGVGIFPSLDSRPPWTGLASIQTTRSDDNAERIYRSADGATQYVRLNHVENVGLKKDGYGILGVCNDSNAIMEAFLFLAFGKKWNGKWQTSPIATYPNVRDSARDKTEAALGLRDSLELIPRDTERTPADMLKPEIRQDTLCRILKMVPYRLTSSAFPDAKLRDQLSQVAEDAELYEHCVYLK